MRFLLNEVMPRLAAISSVMRGENRLPEISTSGNSLVANFLAVNTEKRARLKDNLGPRQGDLVDAIPALFQTNLRFLPGYMPDGVPTGISQFHIDSDASRALRRLAPNYKPSQQSSAKAQIRGLYLMGSPGTIGFSQKSDLDLWLVHAPELEPKEVAALEAKAEKIERYAERLGIEMHFFVFDAEGFRDGSNVTLSAESSGSSQHYLLLDEFYRSGLLLAGLRPLWWAVPPEHEHDYDAYVTAASDRSDLDTADYLDFGGLAKIPADEFFGVALWHLYKSVESPYKSLLKLLLMETYAAEYPDGLLLSHEYKAAVAAEDSSINASDPYVAMYRKVENYLQKRKDRARLDLTRRSFYLKTNVNLSRAHTLHIPKWQHDAVAQLAKSWRWSDAEISHLDDRQNWKIDSAAAERRHLVKALSQSYAVLSNFAKQHGQNQKITQSDLNVLGRKLYAAFERKPSKIDIVTRGICPQPRERDLLLQASYDTSGQGQWSLYLGGSGDVREDDALARAGAPTELLAWSHFNRLSDKDTNFRVIDPKDNLTVSDVSKVLDTLQAFYPDGAVTQQDASALAVAPRPLSALLMINVGVDALDGKLKSGAVLTSNRTDAFRFGGQGKNLVRTVDLLLMTSWEEMFVFRFEGAQGLLQALVEYLQWGIPLGSVRLPKLEVRCLSKDYSQAIQRRVESYAQEVVDMMCANSETEQQLITQFEHAYCCVFAHNDRPDFKFHETVPSLIKALSNPRAAFNQVRFDDHCEGLGALPVIYRQNRNGYIQVFVREIGDEADIYITDEFGALFCRRQECFRLEVVFRQYSQFIHNLLKHDVRSRSDGDGKAVGVELYRLESATGKEFEVSNVTTKMTLLADDLCVRVYVDIQASGKQHFTIYCGDREFSSAEYGGSLFVRIAEYILGQRDGRGTYPIFISDLELSNRFKKQRSIESVQTIHVLNYKKRIEHELTRALRVELPQSRSTI